MKGCKLFILTLFGALILFAMPIAHAWDEIRTYYLYLGTSDSGNTTEASGTSNLIVEGMGYTRADGHTIIHDMDRLADDGKFSIQLDSLSVQNDDSGSTFTVQYAVSDIDDSTHWSGVTKTAITAYNGVAVSGATFVHSVVTPSRGRHIRFYFLTGTTPFTDAKFKVRFK